LILQTDILNFVGFVTTLNSLDSDSDWKCCLCGEKTKANLVKQNIEQMEAEVAELEVSVQSK